MSATTNTRKLPIGIQDFQKLRENNFIYVDKTHLIYELAQSTTPYFLSRPRRFGKSLLISTMEAYFLGRKELFHNLAIEKLEQDWKSYPVLKFSLAGGEFTTADGLSIALNSCLSDFEKKYSLPSENIALPVRFKNALKNAFDQQFSDGSLFVSEDEISDYRTDNPDVVPLLYQSGYLTLKEYDRDLDSFTLGFPNDEVKYGFTASLTPVYFNAETPFDIRSFARDIKNGNTDDLKNRFVSVFTRLPYTAISKEKKDTVIEQNFQNVIYLVFLLLGQFVQVEQHSAKGGADCVAETGNAVYIFEFRQDSSAEEALKQIEAQGYAFPYSADNRTIYKIGINFSSELCNIDGWEVQ